MSLTLVANLDPFGSIKKLTFFFFCKTRTLDRLTMVRKRIQKRPSQALKQVGKQPKGGKRVSFDQMPPSEPDGDDEKSVSSFPVMDSDDDGPNKHL